MNIRVGKLPIVLFIGIAGYHFESITSPSYDRLSLSTADKTVAGKMKGLEILPDEPCSASFGKTFEEDQQKIMSYNFAKAKPYIQNLTIHGDREGTFKLGTIPGVEIPTVVSATSSNHFLEAMNMIDKFNNLVRPAYKNIQLFIYDIGLQDSEHQQVKTKCNCTVVSFPYERFPGHIRHIENYCWKPLIVQLMLQTHKFVMWMDSSIRFLTPDLDSLFAQAKKHGILAFHDVHLLPSHVHEDMFDFLQETPCLYRNFGEFSASLMLVHSDHQIAEEYIIRPWASCALVEHCIETKYPVSRLINCQSHKHYHSSHRYDQALLSILLYRLFHDSYSDHVIDQAYFRWCRSNNC